MRRSSKLLLFCALAFCLLLFSFLAISVYASHPSFTFTTWPLDGWSSSGGSVSIQQYGGYDAVLYQDAVGESYIWGPQITTGSVVSINAMGGCWNGQQWFFLSDEKVFNTSGWHDYVQIQPQGFMVKTITATRAGYVGFYCDGGFNAIETINGADQAPTPTPTATNTPTPTSTPRAYTHDYGVYPPPVCSNLVTYGPGTDSVEYWTYYPFSPYYVEYRSLTGGAPGTLVERWRVDSPDTVHSYVYGPFADGLTVVIEAESGSCGAWSRVEMMAVIHGETAITATVPLVRLEKLPWSAKWGNSFDHHGITSGSYAFGAYTAGGLYDAWVSWDITDTQRHDILFTCWGAIEWGSTTGQSQSYTCDGIPKNFDAGADISEFSASGQMGWIGQLNDYGYNANDPTPTRFPQPTGTATPTACAGCTATPTPWLPASDPRGTATPTPWRTPGAPSVSTPVPVGTARSWIAAPGAYPTPGGNEYQAITDVVEFVTEVNCIDWVIPLTNNLPNGEFFANIPQGYTMCATTIQSLRLFQIDFMPMIIACGSLLVLGTAVNFLRDR
jgi:hypothetical protein